MIVKAHHTWLQCALVALLFLSVSAAAAVQDSVPSCPFVKIEAERLPDMQIPRYSHATFYAGDELTVVGGHTSGFVLTKTAEYFKDGEWHLMQMVYNHDDGVCVPMRNGKVLLAGGYEKNLGIGQTYEAELYDPTTHSFRGFGCLDKKRTHAAGIEIDSGKVVITGNWYHPDGIELYEGKMQFTHVKETSVQRTMPYLFRTSDGDVMMIGTYDDNYENRLKTNVVDRLKGEPFQVPLFDTWQPTKIHLAPRSDDSFIGDTGQGIYAYLLPVLDSTGQVAIAEVRDTVFSLLPTACPVPMKSPWSTIEWYTPIVVDRKAQRGYMLGHCKYEKYFGKYLLSINYAKRPAELTCYYTDSIEGFGFSIPLVMPDGNLVVTGGIGKDSTFFSPSAGVWVFPVGSRPTAVAQSKLRWLWGVFIALIVTTALCAILLKRRQSGGEVHDQEQSQDQTVPDSLLTEPRDEQLMQRIVRLMEERRLYLDSDLKLADVAAALGVHQNEVSRCINYDKVHTFSKFVNGYRIDYAQQLLRQHPDMKMTHVAIESGFANDTTFYRAFKSIVGMPPSEWISQETTYKL